MYYILRYHTVNRFNDRKMKFRSAHLNLVRSYHKDGRLIMGGALLEPNDEALLIFQCDDIQEVETFVEMDPYHINGLIQSYSIRPWAVAIVGSSSAE